MSSHKIKLNNDLLGLKKRVEIVLKELGLSQEYIEKILRNDFFESLLTNYIAMENIIRNIDIIAALSDALYSFDVLKVGLNIGNENIINALIFALDFSLMLLDVVSYPNFESLALWIYDEVPNSRDICKSTCLKSSFLRDELKNINLLKDSFYHVSLKNFIDKFNIKNSMLCIDMNGNIKDIILYGSPNNFYKLCPKTGEILFIDERKCYIEYFHNKELHGLIIKSKRFGYFMPINVKCLRDRLIKILKEVFSYNTNEDKLSDVINIYFQIILDAIKSRINFSIIVIRDYDYVNIKEKLTGKYRIFAEDVSIKNICYFLYSGFLNNKSMILNAKGSILAITNSEISPKIIQNNVKNFVIIKFSPDVVGEILYFSAEKNKLERKSLYDFGLCS